MIPSQPRRSLPPQRQPGQSGHAPRREEPEEEQSAPGAGPLPHWDPPQPRQQQPAQQQPFGAGQAPGFSDTGQRGGEPGAAPASPPSSYRQAAAASPAQPRGGGRHAAEPDWNALADAHDSRSRKRRVRWVSLGVLATLAIAGAVTFALTHGTDAKDAKTARETPSAEPTALPDEPEFPDVTPPPPPNPLAIISSKDKDKAPLNPDTLFPGKQFAMSGRVYLKGPSTITKNCASATVNGLGAVLSGNHCREMLRATYTRDGVSVTIGVAVFDDKATADKVRKQATGNVAALAGGPVKTFCQPVACWRSSNAIGRYAYFTIAGLSNNTGVTTAETKAKQGGRDASTFAFGRITQRGRDIGG